MAVLIVGAILTAWIITDSGDPPLDGAPVLFGRPYRPLLDRLGHRQGAA